MLLGVRSCGEDAGGEEDARAATLEHGVAADMLSPTCGEVGGHHRHGCDTVKTLHADDSCGRLLSTCCCIWFTTKCQYSKLKH